MRLDLEHRHKEYYSGIPLSHRVHRVRYGDVQDGRSLCGSTARMIGGRRETRREARSGLPCYLPPVRHLPWPGYPIVTLKANLLKNTIPMIPPSSDHHPPIDSAARMTFLRLLFIATSLATQTTCSRQTCKNGIDSSENGCQGDLETVNAIKASFD